MTVIVWQYPIIYALFVTEDLKDQVTCWSDLQKLGKAVGVYPTPAGYASHEVFREVFSILFDCSPADLDKILALDASDVSAAGDLQEPQGLVPRLQRRVLQEAVPVRSQDTPRSCGVPEEVRLRPQGAGDTRGREVTTRDFSP
jgi:hypothetical protein